jgi:hypothetical protein
MRFRDAVFAAALAVGCVSAGCATAERITGPSSIDTSNAAGSSQGAERRPSPPDPPAVPPPSGTCDADKARWTAGEPASDDVLERARQAAGAGTARFLRPNEPVTTEYLDSRLNLWLDERDVVRSVNCG